MTKQSIRTLFLLPAVAVAAVGLSVWSQTSYTPLEASSHREAPLIADDPLADNTDLYAFRSPADPTKVAIIANYIPFELPHGGPNYYTFGEDVRYEIHVKNDPATPGDDITYRFTFSHTNDDPSTFFNIRLNQQNLKTTYTCEKSIAGGTFIPIVTNGVVPPNNIGPRSIENNVVGLGAPNYESLRTSAITPATGGGGEEVYCGPADDPFFADLGAIFDLAGIRPANATDGLAKKNVHSIALHIPIATLQKAGQPVSGAANILDGDYVIGVWASASRQQIRTLSSSMDEQYSGSYVQVSRLGMPLTNEVINPIGAKDAWNAQTPYTEAAITDTYLSNPEVGLYMDDRLFGSAVPGLAPLRIQTNSLGSFDFGNNHDGLFPLAGNPALAGTALAPIAQGGFGEYLLRDNQPRSVDILPIFHTGVPNLRPYQLATGKPAGNPLAAGKPFINNFLPLLANGSGNPGGDMLRLNMAVPVTPRNSPDFSNQGLLAAAAAGLTNPAFNNTTIQAIPNMDGFPNGRRLEDAVDQIELKAASGLVLAAIGLWYDDYTIGGNPLTPDLLSVLTFTTGLEANDTTMRTAFPYVQTPWRGTGVGGGPTDIIVPEDLIVSTATNVPGGTYRDVTITSSGAATLTAPLVVTGTLIVQAGGVLDPNCQPITGAGKVIVAADGTLHVCDAAGLSAAGNTSSGTLRNSGSRSLSSDGHYIYDGSSPQVTGVGLPGQVRHLGIANSAGVSLNQNLSIKQLLELSAGTFSPSDKILQLLSNASGTAMVVNAGGTVSGTPTVQRYISTASNAGVGYRHLSSPTTNSAISDLQVSSFFPKVNPAYNTAPVPQSVVPYPNVFGYDETRGGAAVTDFNYGYFSPASTASTLTPGQGYAVYIRGGFTPDFVGPLTQTSLVIPNLTRTGNNLGNAEKSGWHLLGNPFPSPLDWDLVTVPAGMSQSISVFQSTGANSGVYRMRANGVGDLPNGLLPLGQGFFARVTGASPVSLTLPNSARPTSVPFTQPILYRGAADTRPIASLKLRATTSVDAATDETFVYFQDGATADLDDAFDGAKPTHNLGDAPTLLSLTTSGTELAVNGLPATMLRSTTIVPLLFDVAAVGSYTLEVGKLVNLPAGVSVALLDRQLEVTTPLQAGTSYVFQASRTGADAGRFALVFGPTGTVTGVANLAQVEQLTVFPNPASGSITSVRVVGTTAGSLVRLLDGTGRVLRVVKATTDGAIIEVEGLPVGVYTVRSGSQNRRLVVE